MFFNNNRFSDTIFLKESSSLKDKYDALTRLSKEYPDNEEIKEELYIVKKGLEGENEIKYQLEKSNIGMYVLRDINVEYNGLKSQIDYVIITKMYCYFIECKNLIGNIIVNENGDFIREFIFNGRKIKKGMYSPIRQVDAQLDVYRKIWQNRKTDWWSNFLKKYNGDNIFTNGYRGYVVACNEETILNLKYAPNNIKNRVLRADKLIAKIKDDLDNADSDYFFRQDVMLEWGNKFLESNLDIINDYYEDYKNKLVINKKEKKKIKDDICPLCGSKLILKNGKYGKFLGCNKYPECKYTRNV